MITISLDTKILVLLFIQNKTDKNKKQQQRSQKKT